MRIQEEALMRIGDETENQKKLKLLSILLLYQFFQNFNQRKLQFCSIAVIWNRRSSEFLRIQEEALMRIGDKTEKSKEIKASFYSSSFYQRKLPNFPKFQSKEATILLYCSSVTQSDNNLINYSDYWNVILWKCIINQDSMCQNLIHMFLQI